jgi:hypothetical protein
MHSRSHPFVWWRSRRGGGECGTGSAPSSEDWHPGWSTPEGEDFGVRRPLRFLAYRLGLDERQVSELAIILNELKTERAQAAVDNRRVTSAFADAISAEALDEKKIAEAAADRVRSAERLRDAVAKALGKIHALLSPEQRQKLAYLIRTGTLQI